MSHNFMPSFCFYQNKVVNLSSINEGCCVCCPLTNLQFFVLIAFIHELSWESLGMGNPLEVPQGLLHVQQVQQWFMHPGATPCGSHWNTMCILLGINMSMGWEKLLNTAVALNVGLQLMVIVIISWSTYYIFNLRNYKWKNNR